MPSKLVEFSTYTLLWLVATSCIASAAIGAIAGAAEERVRREASAVAVLLDSVASAALRGNESEVRFQLPANVASLVVVEGRTAVVEVGSLSVAVQLSHAFKPATIRPGVTIVARAAGDLVELSERDGRGD